MAIITRIKSWIDRDCLTHTDLNAEFNNITDNIVASDLTKKGLVQLEDSHTSVLTTKAACPKNVKEAYDLAGTMLTKATFDANTFIYAVNDNTPVIKNRAEVMALLSGQAGADFALNTHKITGLVDPTTDQGAATKKYVDGLTKIDGNLTMGTEGGGETYLHIKGSDAAGGKAGGTIYQYMANDYDGTYNYWFQQPYEDDLTWGVPGAVRMKLTSTGDLYIDGTYYDTGASLDKSILEGNKKWKLLTSLVSAYQNHNLTLLAKPLRHKTGDKNGKINITKSSSELIQLQAECIAELHKRLEILEKRT